MPDPAEKSFFRYQTCKLEAVTQITLRERTIACEEIVDLLW